MVDDPARHLQPGGQPPVDLGAAGGRGDLLLGGQQIDPAGPQGERARRQALDPVRAVGAAVGATRGQQRAQVAGSAGQLDDHPVERLAVLVRHLAFDDRAGGQLDLEILDRLAGRQVEMEGLAEKPAPHGLQLEQARLDALEVEAAVLAGFRRAAGGAFRAQEDQHPVGAFAVQGHPAGHPAGRRQHQQRLLAVARLHPQAAGLGLGMLGRQLDLGAGGEIAEAELALRTGGGLRQAALPRLAGDHPGAGERRAFGGHHPAGDRHAPLEHHAAEVGRRPAGRRGPRRRRRAGAHRDAANQRRRETGRRHLEVDLGGRLGHQQEVAAGVGGRGGPFVLGRRGLAQTLRAGLQLDRGAGHRPAGGVFDVGRPSPARAAPAAAAGGRPGRCR